MRSTVFQKLLGGAFILGPILTLLASLIWVAGIDVNPGIMAWGSYTEGVVGYFGFILLVPVFLALAYQLGNYMPTYAGIVALVALLGFAGGGVMNMVLRVIIHDFVEAGASENLLNQLAQAVEAGNSFLLLLILTGPFGPIASILLGIGFLISKQARFRAWLMVLAGLLFMSSQLVQVLPEVGYPLANALWVVVLVPIGVKLLAGKTAEVQLRQVPTAN